MIALLRNNVKRVLRAEQTMKGLKESSPELMIREVAVNSSTDLCQLEIVLAISDPTHRIFQLFTSEGYHKFDVENNTRGYLDAKRITDYKFNRILNYTENSSSIDDDIFEILAPTRSCDYFNIESEDWEITSYFSVNKNFCEEDLKTRYVVYGKGQAWDFGGVQEKALAHLYNLKNKDSKIENNEEDVEESDEEIEE